MTTLALLNLNGVNGSQVFTDETGNQVWSVNLGNPVLDTSDFKFGSSSLYLANDDSSISSILATPLTGDFTIELWMKHESILSTERCLLYFPDLDTRLHWDINRTTIRLIDHIANPDIIYVSAIKNLIDNEFHHIAIVRKDGLLTLFVDGLVSDEPTPYPEIISQIIIGRRDALDDFSGWIDSVRISDVALYNTNRFDHLLSEPGLISTPHPTQAGIGLDVFTFVTDKTYMTPFKGDLPATDIFTFTCGTTDQGGDGGPTTPTSTNIISGNVQKLGLPFEVKIVVMSVEFEPQMLGHTTSDQSTGNYSIDVYPWTGDVLVYAVQDYGLSFNPGSSVTTGQIVHPTTPNKNVYIVQNDGALGTIEPNWPDQGNITSGTVLLSATPLYRPLMNGFLKPIITPI